MPANKYALLRYRIIDDCLTNKRKRFPTKEDIQYACEQALYGSSGERVSISTIEKDLWAMKNEGDLGFYAPIVYSKLEKGYHYEDEDYTIKEISLSHEEKDAIRFAANTLFQFKDLSIFDQFGSAIQKIFDRLNISPEMQDEAIERYVQFESTPVAKGSELLPIILQSIKDARSIRFTYHSFQDDSTTDRKFHPYLLKEYRNRWYVIGKDADKGKIKTFGLDRISELNTAGDLFDIDSKFDPELLFKHSFGITAGGKPEKIVLKFAPLEGRFIKSQPLHPSQKIIKDSKDGLTISIKVIPSYELKSTILSYGNRVEVIEGLTN
ncbi:MAG: putative DNA-binding transcriptional regulator YafY [Granulosicoccus sp.]|jgi:predicted DNA-binding transcriptional regulator YafY